MGDRVIKSAERTIALFELFSATEVPMTVSEIAASLDMPQSSTTMLLRNLSAIGYLDYDRAARRYKPTIRILLLSSWMTRRFGETGRIAELLGLIHEETGDVVMLGLQNGARVQAILTRGQDRGGLQYAAPRRRSQGRIIVKSGMFASLTCSGMGRALLSLKPDFEIRAWVRRVNAEVEETQYRVNESEMLRIAKEVRHQGYSATSGTQLPGLGAFAITVASPMDATPLAISVSLPVENMALKRTMILDRLFRFREEISAAPVPDDDEWLPVPG
jgi:IclR family KDG regulon transcriptional repressor